MYGLHEVLAIVWTLWSIALATTIARGILRWRVQGSFHIEDYLAFASFVFLSGLVGVVVTVTPKFDMVRQYLLAAVLNPLTPPPLSPEEMGATTILSLKLMFAQMLLFWSTLWAAKLSLLVFFRKMVIGLPKYLRIWWIVFTIVIATYLACMLSNFTTCTPLKKYWSATGCSSPNDLKRADASIKFASAADIFSDLLIMILPIRLLFGLQKISMKQKLGLACLFSLGSIVVVFAFIRLFNVTKATEKTKVDPSSLADAPLILSTWSVIEAAVGTIVANLPAFRSFLRTQGQSRADKHSGSEGYMRSDGATFGSRKNIGSRSGIVGRDEAELDSLESDDGSGGRNGRGRSTKAGDIVMTRHISVESRRRLAGEVDNQKSKLGLTLS